MAWFNTMRAEERIAYAQQRMNTAPSEAMTRHFYRIWRARRRALFLYWRFERQRQAAAESERQETNRREHEEAFRNIRQCDCGHTPDALSCISGFAFQIVCRCGKRSSHQESKKEAAEAWNARVLS